ncbi:hypothetical protein C0581_02715, partial [Candidatus Parcubacteria bacterium]
VKLFRDEKHDLLQKAKDGDESAKEALKELNEERKEDLKERTAVMREKAMNMADVIKENGKNAVERLKKMDGRENVNDKIQDLRDRREVTPERPPEPEAVILDRAQDLQKDRERQQNQDGIFSPGGWD